MADDDASIYFIPLIYGILLLGGVFIILTILSVCVLHNYNVVLKIVIITIFVIVSLFTVIYFFIYMLLIGGKNYNTVIPYILSISIIPTVFISIILVSSYKFVGIFENTIGYLFSKAYYGKKINETIILNKVLIDNSYDEYYEKNKHGLITLFEYVSNFNKVYKIYEIVTVNGTPQSGSENINNSLEHNLQNVVVGDVNVIDNNNKNHYNFSIKELNDLKLIVDFKHTIGVLSWFFINSLFVSILSIKMLSRL